MRLYDWWYDRPGQVLVFITELLTDGSLRRFIRRKHAAGITLSALKRYAWQILQGLVYLHGHYPPIIHRWAGVRGSARTHLGCITPISFNAVCSESQPRTITACLSGFCFC
jgi:hypothetical protein